MTVVNRYKEPFDVYIGREGHEEDGYFGNPVVKGKKCPVCNGKHEKPGDTLPCYKKYLWKRVNADKEFRERLWDLKGKVLGCFCHPNPCHGHVIEQWIDAGGPYLFGEIVMYMGEKKMPDIRGFSEGSGHEWLSNMYLTPVVDDEGTVWKSSENYYQAEKTTIPYERMQIFHATPKESKKIAKKVTMRPDWNAFNGFMKLNAMKTALRMKFSNPEMKAKLLATGNSLIVEENYWHDNFWGSCTCSKCGNKGQNHLGILLMEQRDKG